MERHSESGNVEDQIRNRRIPARRGRRPENPTQSTMSVFEGTATPGPCTWRVASPVAPGDDVQLSFGELPDGRIVHISSVARGLACGCICPGCRGALEAHLGDRKKHHFHHHSIGECRFAPETALHKFAKQVLLEHRLILVPAVAGEYKGHIKTKHPEQEHKLDQVVLENRLDGIVPDVIARKRDRELLVEVVVTHWCDEEKIARIERLGIPAIEIDLSEVPESATESEIAEQIIRKAPRKWLYNPRITEARNEVKEQLRKEANDRELRAEQKLQPMLAAIATAKTRPATASAHTERVQKVLRDGYGNTIGLALTGDFCFSVDRKEWQALIVDELILSPERAGSPRSFTTTEALKKVRTAKFIMPQFAGFIDQETEATLRTHDDGFRTPYHVIEQYLRNLEYREVTSCRGHRWGASERVKKQSEDRRAMAGRYAERRNTMRNLVYGIIDKLPFDEREHFDVELWMPLRIPEIDNWPTDQMISQYDKAWRRLSAIENMVMRNGDVVDDLFELPLEVERQRQLQKRAERDQQLQRIQEAEEAKAGDERVARLARLASDYFGEQDKRWEDSTCEHLSGAIPTELARSNAAGFDRAFQAMAVEHKARQDERQRQMKAADCQQKLSEAACSAYDTVRAALFLNSGHNRLKGNRPIEFCVDEASLATCLGLLPSAGRRRRS